MNYEEALKLLDSRGFGLKPNLKRIEGLADLLDHPERTYPVIHIAGTNGKSSTARMIGWILAAHGIKTGVFTSPHLQSVRERFLLLGSEGGRVAGGYMSTNEFAEAMSYLAPFLDQLESGGGEQLSYFELTTAIAFEWMAQSSVAVGVFEAGLGGTWDSTNVVQSDVAVITRVDVDHRNFLGSTPLENAREKAGIIKPASRVVAGPQRPEVQELIESAALENGTKAAVFGRDFFLRSNLASVGGRALYVEGIRGLYDELIVGLHGEHQGENAAIAIAACEEFLGKELDGKSLKVALASVESPGRLEVVRSTPLVVLDGAHNPDGAKALASTFRQTFGAHRTTLVIAISRDKDIEGILDHLLSLGEEAIFTASDEKPADPELIAKLARGRIDEGAVKVILSIPDAIDYALGRSGADDAVLVTGSLYAVGEARDHLLGKVP
jgi:dihydrofolate synthase/folylpolyglutamate synthase